jgi:hypothetical protein
MLSRKRVPNWIAGSQKPGVRSRKSGVRSRKPEAGSLASDSLLLTSDHLVSIYYQEFLIFIAIVFILLALRLIFT